MPERAATLVASCLCPLINFGGTHCSWWCHCCAYFLYFLITVFNPLEMLVIFV